MGSRRYQRKNCKQATTISFGFLSLSARYITIERLVDDTSPQNTYRHNVYTSVTGGGSGGKSLFFATDAAENRRHRAYFSQFMRNAGLIERGDWALSTHWEGNLYRYGTRALDID